MQDFEKLGSFYLGQGYEVDAGKRNGELLLYDSKDLLTHAVCVGMTGSGKTGLCTVLLEEAAIDGIPAIVIDPKGDLGNLLLTFPEMKAEEFRPWVMESDAARQGVSVDQFAQQQADHWKKGLSDWGQDAGRIARLRKAAQFAIYTPGSNAGLSVSIIKSFAAPERAILDDDELLRDRINTTVSSLLGLIGVEADPLRSRDHILLSTIINTAWCARQDLDLVSLIQQVQKPAFSRVGVIELETFYPATERFGLAMQLNNVLASPGFSRWMEGEPLDIGSLLYTATGQPRISIFSIAHLNDAERMFFVSLLLNQTLGWVRTQSGTTSLRALLYMDEIAGYFPPVANPPSKAPLLTLMKQARAFGLGVVLATQNPVDLDYKGLSNAGTWFLGRLQTEQDKARVLDGLQGASVTAAAHFDRASIEQTLSRLGKRVFLMSNVHEDNPVVFETRWALSYLRGPMTRAHIKTLTDATRTSRTDSVADQLGSAPSPSEPSQAASTPNPTVPSSKPERATSQRPVLPPDVPQYFIPCRSEATADSMLQYRPRVLACGKIYYQDSKLKIEYEDAQPRLADIRNGPVAVNWDDADSTNLGDSDLEHEPREAASFATLPTEAAKPKSYEKWKKSYVDLLYRTERLQLFRSELGCSSHPAESERDFRVRLQQVAREQRDAIAAKLRQKYAPKAATLRDRIRRAQQQVEVQKAQAEQSKLDTMIAFGGSILSAFMGRKSVSAASMSKAGSAVRGVGRSMKEGSDVARAGENVEALQQQLTELEAMFQAEVQEASLHIDPLTETFEVVTVKPRKTHIAVQAVVLAWAPYWVNSSGAVVAAWE